MGVSTRRYKLKPGVELGYTVALPPGSISAINPKYILVTIKYKKEDDTFDFVYDINDIKIENICIYKDDLFYSSLLKFYNSEISEIEFFYNKYYIKKTRNATEEEGFVPDSVEGETDVEISIPVITEREEITYFYDFEETLSEFEYTEPLEELLETIKEVSPSIETVNNYIISEFNNNGTILQEISNKINEINLKNYEIISLSDLKDLSKVDNSRFISVTTEKNNLINELFIKNHESVTVAINNAIDGIDYSSYNSLFVSKNINNDSIKLKNYRSLNVYKNKDLNIEKNATIRSLEVLKTNKNTLSVKKLKNVFINKLNQFNINVTYNYCQDPPPPVPPPRVRYNYTTFYVVQWQRTNKSNGFTNIIETDEIDPEIEYPASGDPSIYIYTNCGVVREYTVSTPYIS